jgi:molybdopterin synthase catalytic subunit
MFQILDSPLPTADISRAALDGLEGGAGAVVTFEGVVRNNAGGKPVHYLEYSAYTPMAEAKMREIGDEVREKWGFPCAMAHRVGRLEIGEASICIAVASPHRRDAFDACLYAINRVKEAVPVWKKEVAPDGTWWVEDPLSDPKLNTHENAAE